MTSTPNESTSPDQDPYPYADLVGERVHVAGAGAVTITGTLRPAEDGLHVVDLGAMDVLMRPAHVERITPPQDAPKDANGDHQLAKFMHRVSDEDWADARAVHEAAHAVIGQVLGIQVERAWVARSRTAYTGGGVEFTVSSDVQLTTVHRVAAPLAHARRIAELGYDHLTQAAVEILCGQGDQRLIRAHQEAGWICWIGQAHRDAERLLDVPAVWEAVLKLGLALQDAGEEGLDGGQIDAVIGDAAALTDYRVWTPDTSGL
jgi:hypothetical protein